MPSKSTKRRGIIKYKSYVFVNKDPVIDVVRTAWSDSRKTYKQMAEGTGISVGTFRSWFGGKTKRPQFATVASALTFLGKTSIEIDRTGKVKVS